jgi:hypothetical protein
MQCERYTDQAWVCGPENVMDTYKPIPKHPAFVRYDAALSVVKEQIDIMLRENPLAAMQWLNEVQRCLNRARDDIAAHNINQDRDVYLE